VFADILQAATCGRAGGLDSVCKSLYGVSTIGIVRYYEGSRMISSSNSLARQRSAGRNFSKKICALNPKPKRDLFARTLGTFPPLPGVRGSVKHIIPKTYLCIAVRYHPLLTEQVHEEKGCSNNSIMARGLRLFAGRP
jgi:hypothetical protein